MMATYDPTTNDRSILARALRDKMAECGFASVVLPGTREEVYERSVDGTGNRIKVRVYTTIEGGRCRSSGSDAIRVCAVYKSRKDGKERGIASADHRVNRVGKMEDIVDRTYHRMREVYKKALNPARCKCGAPTFKSKKGRSVCADLCWLDKGSTTKRAAEIAAKSRNRRAARVSAYRDAHAPNPARIEAEGPPPGTWAATARMMAGRNPSAAEGEFWDRWKDEMKERR